jgi:hypothetical protein
MWNAKWFDAADFSCPTHPEKTVNIRRTFSHLNAFQKMCGFGGDSDGGWTALLPIVSLSLFECTHDDKLYGRKRHLQWPESPVTQPQVLRINEYGIVAAKIRLM